MNLRDQSASLTRRAASISAAVELRTYGAGARGIWLEDVLRETNEFAQELARFRVDVEHCLAEERRAHDPEAITPKRHYAK